MDDATRIDTEFGPAELRELRPLGGRIYQVAVYVDDAHAGTVYETMDGGEFHPRLPDGQFLRDDPYPTVEKAASALVGVARTKDIR